MTRRPFRKRVPSILVAAAALLAGATVAASADASSRAVAAADRVDVYTGELTAEQLQTLNEAGVDHADVLVARGSRNGSREGRGHHHRAPGPRPRRAGRDAQAQAHRRAERRAAVLRPAGRASSARTAARATSARSCSRSPRDNPRIAQAVTIGQQHPGQADHGRAGEQGRLARSRTASARPSSTRPPSTPVSGSRPRWSAGCCTTTSTTTAATRELTRIVDTTDLWFIPVVNVDGYDYTFTEDNRLWRKNLRDNDGDGQITGPGRRRPQPQLPLQVGLRQRGLLRPARRTRPTAARRRAPSPRRRPRSGSSTASGPSTRSTGTRPPSCCCYGVGWQALTSSPDDLIHQAIVGDPDHARRARATSRSSAPSSTRPTARPTGTWRTTSARSRRRRRCPPASRPRRPTPTTRGSPADCGSGFEFPDDETLIAARRSRRTSAYAIDVAKSAQDPDDPVSPVGRTVPDFDPDEFGDSYGAQPGGGRRDPPLAAAAS